MLPACYSRNTLFSLELLRTQVTLDTPLFDTKTQSIFEALPANGDLTLVWFWI